MSRERQMGFVTRLRGMNPMDRTPDYAFACPWGATVAGGKNLTTNHTDGPDKENQQSVSLLPAQPPCNRSL
ncbi:hypothetical protein FACS1894110_19880 [Spirochaetia bacterium]|nr:hypothetical protein FACS1894110_19880 [Spirochaetia bacterium]